MALLRWALAGTVLGGAVVLLAFAPAAWLASAVSSATGERLQLADARGTVWNGSAVMVLTGGVGSRSASALPGRFQWTLGLDGAALGLRGRQACCINGELRVRVTPGFGRVKLELLAESPAAPTTAAAGVAGVPRASGALGQWPASWLVGLGTPWNTLQPSGTLQLSSPGLVVEQVSGRWLFNGRAEVELGNMASRVSTLDVLGSYRITLTGDTASGQPPRMQLVTTSGALLLNGEGQWSGSGGAGSAARLRFNGTASAAPGAETALGGLLNIIGRRQGAVSLITIG